MYKIFVLSYAVLTVAKGYTGDEYHINDYITVHNRQNLEHLNDYDRRLENFKNKYLTSLELHSTYGDMLIKTINQANEDVTPLEYLSHQSNQCVELYRHNVTGRSVTRDLKECYAHAGNITLLLADTFKIREKFKEEIKISDEGVKTCHYGTANSRRHFTCLYEVYDNLKNVLISNGREFEYHLDVAECTANANLKKFAQCIYKAQHDALKKVTESTQLIDDCLSGKDECPPCGPNTCSEKIDVKRDYYSKEKIANPFYGKDSSKTCYLLKVVN